MVARPVLRQRVRFGRSWRFIHVLQFAAAIALLASVAAARTPTDTLVVGQVAEPKSLDPHTVTSLNDFRIAASLYQGLVRFKPGTLEIAPALAERWEISDDGRVYTFDLRKGVRFQDGTPFDAAAVKFNFDRMRDKNNPYHNTGPFPLAFFFKANRTIRVLGPHRIRFILDRPFAPLLSNLAYPAGFIVSPAAVRKWGKAYGRHPVGTGPFRFMRWDSRRRVVLVRYAGYAGPRPHLKRLVFAPIPDANTRVAAFLAGEIDVLLGAPPDVIAALRHRRDLRVIERTGPHLWFLILNMRRGPFRDRRLRLAANLAIDKTALVRDVLQGTATVAAGVIPPAFAWADNPAVRPYPYDPDRARRLVRAAGYDGRPIVFYVTEGGSGMLAPLAMATAIQADLAAVGLKVEIRKFEWNAYLSRVNAGLDDKADMAEMAWMTDDPDTLPYLALRRGAWPSKGGFNSGYYANPEVDRLLERARRATDRKVRAAAYRKVEAIVHHDVPWVVVANWRQNVVVRRTVRGLRLEPSFLLRFVGVEKRAPGG
jgi:peptide/nickel transport system substrate-binding protein